MAQDRALAHRQVVTGGVVERLRPLLDSFFPDGLAIELEFWDGSTYGDGVHDGSVRIVTPRALRRMVWSPDELGVARALVTGDLAIEGDIFTVLRQLRSATTVEHRVRVVTAIHGVAAAARCGAIGLPPEVPPEEVRLHGRRHSTRRDATAVTHHYDVGNDFYELVLGPAMTYSCARFENATSNLEEAQRAKHELICRKLALDEIAQARLLDVGCGWGTMVMYAAEKYGARATGITLSSAQVDFARTRVNTAGLEQLVEIRREDYRELAGEQFDAICSVGMFEHVGARRMTEYFTILHRLLVPRGRLLNHAISSPGGSRKSNRKFISRYVFPDGELLDVGETVLAMERAGFEVRDVESLREHYSRTLHEWVANLERSWDTAVQLVGERKVRIWHLYMAASANAFDEGVIAVHQVLGVVPDSLGTSAMPVTRGRWG